jgi:predicted RNase H-like HicB family nuclease
MELHYSMDIRWSEEDKAFVVSLPEFPDCQTHGATYEEAARMGREALESVIEAYQSEGRSLPEPRLVSVK